ncbi:MAG: ABC transporter permease [Actinobacteria bacterium]|nr:ABC transporter permease [Actinomycetota bacterium]
MTLKRGESLLLTLGIPVVLLVFFAEVHVLPASTRKPVNFLAPGILALAVMSTSMVSLGIATGFERSYKVLKRLGTTPLGRPALLAGKMAAVVLIEIIQAIVLVAVALAIGWRPGGNGLEAIGVIALGTVAFSGLGLLLAGTLKAEVNLALVNGLYLVLLLAGNMIIPLSRFPAWMATLAKALPAAALSEGLFHSLNGGTAIPAWAWLVLVAWAIAAPVAAGIAWKWE